jgi:hypothetical protein
MSADRAALHTLPRTWGQIPPDCQGQIRHGAGRGGSVRGPSYHDRNTADGEPHRPGIDPDDRRGCPSRAICSPNGLTSILAQSLIAGPPVIIERFVGTVAARTRKPQLFSRQRRRAAAEPGYTRLLQGI